VVDGQLVRYVLEDGRSEVTAAQPGLTAVRFI
jgi:hypothetical protein